jgi:coenzyme F420-dependent glucose-6-phosphate dehydrogenase
MRYFYGAAHEQFPPEDLLTQAVEAERAGFDGVACSDHLQPWWEPGESGHAWVWLGAAGQATDGFAIGTAVTPPGPRYHPVLIAQAWATLERMFPGRPFLGIGSGESLNESPLAAIWPPAPEQVERMEEGLEIIRRLFEGERLSYEGRHFETDEAILHTEPPTADLRLGLRPQGRRRCGPLGRWPLDTGRPGVGTRRDRCLQGCL